MNGFTIFVAILVFMENMHLILTMPIIGAQVTVTDYRAPTARIIVHVRRKRAKYWDFWQLNSRICPPSLCVSSDGGAARPRGTAGSVFYNGDIVLDTQTERYIYGASERRKKRAAIRLKDRHWPKGIVYYMYADNISKGAKKALRQAMRHISEKTCIQFKKKKNKHTDYIRFISEPGCWSNVGRVGGEQKLSLGRGCERVGTAIHELAHSIGFWHEQARPDRDKYVEVDLENVSPKYIPDFNKINRTLANSRGYPYDYSSIMHYNERTFTINGRKTIKVIGIGKTLALRIGQRDQLSNIDIAQLRDMYYCNRKQDTLETVCPKGWVKDRRSCYKFINRPRYQFAAAKKYCDGFKSNLVHIKNKYTDKFLKKYLKKTYKKSKVWRIGARRLNGTFVWDNGGNRKPSEMSYTNWPDKEPSGFTAIALSRDNLSDSFEWRGVWTGSLKQMPDYTYSFICERQARRKCFPGKYRDGRDYRGDLSHTVSGITCQNWTSKYPHRHSLLASGNIENNTDGLGDHNYCRNPKRERRNRPWCFTTKEKIEWEYCDVITCSGTIIDKSSNSVVNKETRDLTTVNKDKLKMKKNKGNTAKNNKSKTTSQTVNDQESVTLVNPNKRNVSKKNKNKQASKTNNNHGIVNKNKSTVGKKKGNVSKTDNKTSVSKTNKDRKKVTKNKSKVKKTKGNASKNDKNKSGSGNNFREIVTNNKPNEEKNNGNTSKKDAGKSVSRTKNRKRKNKFTKNKNRSKLQTQKVKRRGKKQQNSKEQLKKGGKEK